MNRQTKRMMQRQGQVGPDGEAVAPRAPRERQSQAVAKQRQAARRERTPPATFVREVRGELRRVAWPSRDVVINLSVIVLLTLAVMMALIFALDFVFARSILLLFETPTS